MSEPIPFHGASKPDDGKDSREESPQRSNRIYTSEEVTELIRIALQGAEHLDRDAVNYEELVSIGREFGLKESDLERAFTQMNQTRLLHEQSGRAWLTFRVHLITFGVIIAGLFLINALATPDQWWVLYPIIAWGMVVALHGTLAKLVPEISNSLLSAGWEEKLHTDIEGHAAEPIASFKNDLYEGLAEIKGVVRVQDEALIIEYQSADALFGFIKSRVNEMAVPLDEIESARLTRGIMSNKLILTGKSMRTFEDVPGSHGPELRLAFSGPARQASERLARQLTTGA